MAQIAQATIQDRQQQIAHRLIDDQLNALRVAVAINAALQPLFAGLVSRLRPILAIPITDSRTAQATIRQAKYLIEKNYRQMQQTHARNLTDFAEAASLATAKTMQAGLEPTVNLHAASGVTITTVLLAGATTQEWWQKQAATTVAGITREVRLSLVNAAGTPALMANVFGTVAAAGVLDRAERGVRQIAHTSTTAVANHAREEFCTANDGIIYGLGWLATLDGRTCLYCAARDGKEYTMGHQPIGHALAWDEGPGAAHFSCRCVALPLLSTARERRPGATAFSGTRSSADGQIAASTTFTRWLDGKSRAFQDEYFGPGRADLWRNGHLTLTELLDMRGRPLTIDALKEKVASG